MKARGGSAQAWQGGATFTTLTLQPQGRDWAFRPTPQALLFSGGTLAGGAAMALFGLVSLAGGAPGGLAFLLAGLVFTAVGSFLWALMHSGAQLNLLQRRLSVRRPRWDAWCFRPAERTTLDFAGIHAIQLRSRRIVDDDGPAGDYTNTVVELVALGGERHELVAHVNAERAVADARRLSQLTGAPLRDRRLP